MIERIWKAIAVGLFAATMSLGFAGVASAATVDIAPGTTNDLSFGGDNYFDTNINLTSNFDFSSGSGTVYTFDVANNVATRLVVTAINQTPSGSDDLQVANLTFTWHLVGGSDLISRDFTGDDAVQDEPSTLFASLTGGIGVQWELIVTGIAGSGGGGYFYQLTAVPIPAAALLFGSALLGGGLMRRRKMIKEFGLPA